ncbi:hypothetical protein GGQ85_003599 [Nitrobacter vulgaris]|nr:hypothetical protein [Nitrobacter vulgaris]
MRFWSGTPFHVSKSLASEGNDVVHVGPLNAPILPLYKTYASLSRTFRRGGFLQFMRGLSLRSMQRLPRGRSGPFRQISFLRQPDPPLLGVSRTAFLLMYASDATCRLVENYHSNYRNLSRAARDCDVIDLRGRSQGAGLNNAGASLRPAINELCRASASHRAQVPYVELGVGRRFLASKSGIYATA